MTGTTSQRHLTRAAELRAIVIADFDREVPAWTWSPDEDRPVLPDASVPLLRQVDSQDRWVRQLVTVQQLYYILDYYVTAEQGAVGDACHHASEGTDVDLPPTLRAGAAAVARQETVHSGQFIRLQEWIRRRTGITPLPYEPAFLQGVDQLFQDGHDTAVTSIVFAALTEVYPPTLAPLLARTPSVQDAIRTVFREHEQEEILHRLYWWTVLEELWKTLTSERRDALRRQMPLMLACHLRADPGALQLMQGSLPDGVTVQPRSPDRAEIYAAQDLVRQTVADVASGLRRIGVLSAAEAQSLVDAVVTVATT